MGSSNFWATPHEGCENRIPIEITRKIEQKIKEGARFTAFIGMSRLSPLADPSDPNVSGRSSWRWRSARNALLAIQDYGYQIHDDKQTYIVRNDVPKYRRCIEARGIFCVPF